MYEMVERAGNAPASLRCKRNVLPSLLTPHDFKLIDISRLYLLVYSIFFTIFAKFSLFLSGVQELNLSLEFIRLTCSTASTNTRKWLL